MMRQTVVTAALMGLLLMAAVPRAQTPPARTPAAPARPAAAAAPMTLTGAVNPLWAAGDAWNGGTAELAAYDGVRIAAGEPRAHTLTVITVAEELNKEYWTKADWPPGQKPLLPAIRQTTSAELPMPSHPLRLQSTVFQERGALARGIKLTVATQGWDGAVFKEFQLTASPAGMTWHSHRDGEGSGSARLPAPVGTASQAAPEVYFEEQLPLLVRALRFRAGLEAAFLLYPNQTVDRADPPRAAEALLVVTEPARGLWLAAGEYAAKDYWQVDVRVSDGRRLQFAVLRAAPQTLLRWDAGAGRRYELKTVQSVPATGPG